MDSQTLIILITVVGIIGAGIGITIFVINKKLAELKKPEDSESQKIMLDIMEKLRNSVDDGNLKNRQEIENKLTSLQNSLQNQLSKGIDTTQKSMLGQIAQSTKIIKEISSEFSKFSETGKQVLDVSKQLNSLENILKNPKQRGILGEYYLETLLSQVIPPNNYKMQYEFKNGDKVDAAVFYNNLIVPIDAKFSLEKYNEIMQTNDKDKREKLEKSFKMDIKNRIDETAKYIRTEEGTSDIAIMYIPAEGIYYNLLIYKSGTINLNSQDLIQYAHSKKVIITSPTSFYAYLQTILQFLKEQKMRESFKEINKGLIQLGKHLNSYEVYMQKLGNNLGTTVNMYNHAYREFGKIDKDVYKITDGKSGGKVEIKLIDKPSLDE